MESRFGTALRVLAAIVVLCIAATAATALTSAKQPGAQYVPGRIIVGFADGAGASVASGSLSASIASVDQLNARFGVKGIAPVYPEAAAGKMAAAAVGQKLSNVYVLTFASNADPTEVAAAYAKLPEVRYAEPDYIRHALRTDPDDAYWTTSNSWGQGYRDQWDMELMACPAAWDVQKGSRSVVIAVSDTGVDYNHPDIAANMWHNPGEIPGNGIDDDGNGRVDDYYGYDFANSDADPYDDNGHGTHCAGTIGAVGNNGTGIAGINWQCSIMAVKGLSASGSGSDSGLAAGIVYAADEGADVISMSWGGSGVSQTTHDALVYAHDVRGCVLVVAGGNDASNITGYHPAMDNYAITVAASDPTDANCGFSNWGVKTAVSAPGGGPSTSTPPCATYNCLSLRAGTTDLLSSGCGVATGIVGTNYYRLAGTSMACPHVAGLAGLILAQNPNWTNEQVRQAIQMRADDVQLPGFDRNSGFGRINAFRSVTSPEPVTALITSPTNGGRAWNTVTISGTAAGPGFSGYTLDCGIGLEPTVWTTITTSSTPVTMGTLGQWDTTAMVPGVHTLRLRTTGTGGALNAEYRIEFMVSPPQGSGHFTEMFDGLLTFDLANTSLVLTPNGSAGFYSLCKTPITSLPTDPTGGTALILTDDSFAQVALSGTSQVSIYGAAANTFYVGSNGYITFDSGDTSLGMSYSRHFAYKRVSALFDDLYPSAGQVTWKQLSDRVAVTYLNVREFGTSNQNTFQIEMFFDGRIAISYLAVADIDGLVGISAGLGQPSNFAPTDFTSYGTCVIAGRALRITQPNGGEIFEPGNIVPVAWAAQGADWLSADRVSLDYWDNDHAWWAPIPGADSLDPTVGTFLWDTSGMPASSQYLVRVLFAGDPAINDASDASFTISPDTDPPVITHTPLTTGNDVGPYRVCATVTDRTGVRSVTLHYSKNDGETAILSMTSTGGSQYCADIAGPSASGDHYCYYIEASDLARVTNTSSLPAAGDYCFSISNGLPLPTPLFDRDSYRWDIQGDGTILDGTNDAYDRGLALSSFPTFTQAAAEDGGREIVIGPASVLGATITRKIYVPTSQAYCRFLEVVTNPGATPLTVPVNIATNLGSDSGTVLVGTSDGDTTFAPTDHWIVTDDEDGTGDPTITHVISGVGGSLLPSSVSCPTGYVYYNYTVGLLPGQTKIIMHFGVQSQNQAIALAKAPQIASLDPVQECLAGMSALERSQVANFALAGRTLALNTPNGGELYEPGTMARIQWNTSGIDWQPADTVTLEYSIGGGSWTSIAGAAHLARSLGSFDWQTDGLPLSDQYRVRVVFDGDASVSDSSDGVFSIMVDTVPPVVNHTPLGNTGSLSGPYGVSALVTDQSGVANATLHYSKNGGGFVTMRMIASGITSEYLGIIAGPSVIGDRYCYYIEASDGAATPNTTRVPASGEYCFNIVDQLQVLSFIGYSDNTTGGEYHNTLGAIQAGCNIANTELSDYTALESALVGKDVLLVPEQENTSLAQMTAIGQAWAPVLQSFLARGGRIVVCDFGPGSYGVLTGAGLMSISGSSNIAGMNVEVSDPSSPIVDGVASPYTAMDGSLSFDTSETGVIVRTAAGAPVVIAKPIAAGEVILLGHDFFSSNSSMDRLVANAVCAPLAGRRLRVAQPNGGENYEPGQIVSIQWTATGTDWLPSDTVTVEFSADGGETWFGTCGSGGLAYNAGSFNWDTMGVPESDTYKVRVVFDGDPLISDASDADFTLMTDTTPPVITHTPLTDTMDALGPYDVCATVTDIRGLEAVTLYYSKNGGEWSTTEMVPSGAPDGYCGSIPGPSVEGDRYCYIISATDLARMPNKAREPVAGEYCFSITSCRPEPPSNPMPEDGATSVPCDVTLSWGGLGGLYSEDFNDGLAQGWQPTNPDRWNVVSGLYCASSDQTLTQSLYTGNTWADCSYQATMLGGDQPSPTYAVVRATPDFIAAVSGSAYVVAASPDGNYCVFKQLSGPTAGLQNWTTSPYLNVGGPNVVQVSISGSTIKVFFNGNLAWSGTDASIRGAGYVGLIANPGTYYFDDVIVGLPDTAEAAIGAVQQSCNAHPISAGGPYFAPAKSGSAAAQKPLVATTAPVSLIQNGGFETGDFSGWTTVSGPGDQLTPWEVTSQGVPGPYFGNAVPFEGAYFANNGFDGSGGLYYDLYQEVTIPSAAQSALLEWSERLQWSIGGTVGRTYEVTLQPAGGGAPLARLFSTTLGPITAGDSAYVTHSVDLIQAAPGVAGQTVRINFHESIPETFTGPAQFDLDGISLVADAPVEPDVTYDVLMGTSPDSLLGIVKGLGEPMCSPGPLSPHTTYYWRVIARNACGETEGPIWSFRTESTSITKPADGSQVEIAGGVVTAYFPDFFYVESDTRECGIRVQKPAHGMEVNWVTAISGVIQTNFDGERYIADPTITVLSRDIVKVAPLGLTNKALGGGDWMCDSGTSVGQRGIAGMFGLNNIGLLVRTTGKVTARGRDWFYIDDGSNVQDGTGITGVYCETPHGVAAPSVGTQVALTGISSCELYRGSLVNVLRVRDLYDPDAPPPPPFDLASVTDKRPRDR